jgi:hypothetical protein
VDQGISSDDVTGAAPAGRALRLALLLVGAVSGLLLISFTVGSSSASADDGGDSPASLGSVVGGVVSTVTDAVPAAAPVTNAVSHVVHAVTHSAPATTVVTPVAQVADEVVVSVLGEEPLGTAPVGSLLTPVAAVIDKSLGGAADAIGPVFPAAVADALAASAPTAADVTGAVLAVPAALVAGTADGVVDLAAGGSLLAGDAGAGLTAPGSPLLAAVSLGGFVLLLTASRHLRTSRAMPGSPVYETDSSPD